MEKIREVIKGSNKKLDIINIRSHFPMLQEKYHGKPLIYLDNAASAQKPDCVLETLQHFYSRHYAKPKEENELSRKVTEEVENARKKMASFIGAKKSKEVIFTRGCTESINILAGGFAKGILKEKDEIIITAMEHHANIVPWQIACEKSGAVLKVIPVSDTGELQLEVLEELINDRTKLISVVHASHVLGTILPIKEITKLAHKRNIPVFADGAQAIPHLPIDVGELDCDFYAFSGHKMGSPSGIGVLYGKEKWLDKIPPIEGGGDMATKVSFEKYEIAELPSKFESGTTPFAEIIAWGTLIDYLNDLGMDKIAAYENELLRYGLEELNKIDEVSISGNYPDKAPLICFHLGNKDMKKLEKYVGEEYNIIMRSGDLTAQPLLKILGVKGLGRLSFAFYNTKAEIDAFIIALRAFINKS
jgi:cysteine desulfurase/selenocysteine lyase